jgi:hypothetical protein
MLLLLLAQMVVSFCYLVDLRHDILRRFSAKFIVAMQMVLTIPSLLTGVESIALGEIIPLAVGLLLFTFANTLIYSTMQIECSF